MVMTMMVKAVMMMNRPPVSDHLLQRNICPLPWDSAQFAVLDVVLVRFASPFGIFCSLMSGLCAFCALDLSSIS